MTYIFCDLGVASCTAFHVACSAIMTFHPVAVWFRPGLGLSGRFRPVWFGNKVSLILISCLRQAFGSVYARIAFDSATRNMFIVPHVRLMEGSTRLLKCSRTFWLLWRLLGHCAICTQELDPILGFKRDAIQRTGERNWVRSCGHTRTVRGTERTLWVKAMHKLRSMLNLPSNGWRLEWSFFRSPFFGISLHPTLGWCS